ncbi:hypothetical protein IX51_06000 [uncultured archaeon]|nr:hypothetical protein IX51_06000 [uncultured archaeon]
MNKKILPVFAVVVVAIVLTVAFLPFGKNIEKTLESKYFISGSIVDPSFQVTGYNNHTWFTSSLRNYAVNNTSIVVTMNDSWGHAIDTPYNVYLVSMKNTLNYSVNLTITTNYTHGQFFYYNLNNSNTSMVFEKVIRNATTGNETFSVVNLSAAPSNIGSWLNNTNYFEIGNGWIVQNRQQINVPAGAILSITLANYQYSFDDTVNSPSPSIMSFASPFVSNAISNNTSAKYESGVISI